MKKYIVPEARLIELLNNEAILDAYRAGGVDSWEWGEDSLNDHYTEVTEVGDRFIEASE